MNKSSLKRFSQNTPAFYLGIALLVVLGISGFGIGWLEIQNSALQTENKKLTEEKESAQNNLNQAVTDKNNLLAALNTTAAKSQSFSDQLDQVNQSLETLQRQASVDPELLEKYSKVFFLNENYKPSALSPIDTRYLYNKSNPLQFHDRALMFLQQLMKAAEADGINLKIISAYRSFGTQAQLKSSYKVTYGAGTANSFSADQGYSEHQLGTAIDFTTTSVGSSFSGFDKTPAYAWLQANAYKYGFILSYPPNNKYYIYEPWHWRFVSLDLALTLHNEQKNFYDLDQRDINNFLANFFNGTTTITTH